MIWNRILKIILLIKKKNINNIEDKKSINLDNINLDFNINSEEKKIRDINNLDNIINNTQ